MHAIAHSRIQQAQFHQPTRVVARYIALLTATLSVLLLSVPLSYQLSGQAIEASAVNSYITVRLRFC